MFLTDAELMDIRTKIKLKDTTALNSVTRQRLIQEKTVEAVLLKMKEQGVFNLKLLFEEDDKAIEKVKLKGIPLGATCHYERIGGKWFVVWSGDFIGDGSGRREVPDSEAFILNCGYYEGKNEKPKEIPIPRDVCSKGGKNEYGIDGQHLNVYCKKCFEDK